MYLVKSILSAANRVDAMKEKKDSSCNLGYRMTQNVNKIVEQFQTKVGLKLEGEIRDRDLQAAATLLGEPLFVSKGHFSKEYFEENVLLDFNAVRDRYMELFEEAIFSLDKENLVTGDSGLKPSLFDIRLMEFEKHINKLYKVFYPYSKEYFKNQIKWKCEHIMESYSGSYDENKDYRYYVRIDEETVWFANTYTNEFINELKNQFYEVYELDEDSGLSHNGVDGISIDEEEGVIQFYTWSHPIIESDSSYIRWDLIL